MDITYNSLYTFEGLAKLDKDFQNYLHTNDVDLYEHYLSARTEQIRKDNNLTLDLAKYLEGFLIQIFNLEGEVATVYQQHYEYALCAKAKRQFVQRYAIKKYPNPKPEWQYVYQYDTDLIFSQQCLKALEENSIQCEILAQYAAWATLTADGQLKHPQSLLFKSLQKISETFSLQNITFNHGCYSAENIKDRAGFFLTDQGFSNEKAADTSHYCIICHPQGKDSCRTGLTNSHKHGCPLDENISVMHALKREGLNIAALAAVMVDNPMVPLTGHRICNDCMVSCIFQKQEPVNTPAVETHVIQSVLTYSYGFEIYSLLTRWNPLNFAQPLPKPKSGYKVLVVGLGPAGLSMAYYLAREGHEVLAIDGTKLEPLAKDLQKSTLVKNNSYFQQSLAERTITGFGGVLEYGITVRWNKNFLNVVRAALERQDNLHFLGGVRYGSQIHKDNIKPLGFDAVAFCSGAGKPNILPVAGNQLPGVRMASDFLMSLQLTGAFRENLIANIQVLTPIVVIGGGLTALDAATEAKAYYAMQREKFFKQYFALLETYAEEEIQRYWGSQDHAAFQNLQKYPMAEVRILYRKNLTQAPSYKQNAQEIESALKEGVIFEENVVPLRFEADSNGWVSGIHVKRLEKEEYITAKTILLALGTEHTHSNQPFLYGDANPSYAGSVVKALASAKDGYQEISNKLSLHPPLNTLLHLDQFKAHVMEIKTLNPNLVELRVHSPLAAKAFSPGQFYKLQNFEVNAPVVGGMKMMMEPLALTPKAVDPLTGMLTFVIVMIGTSSMMVPYLKAGEEITLLGPLGSPTHLNENKTILLIGGGQFNIALIHLAQALKAKGNNILWVAGYAKSSDIFYQTEIENTCDQIWYYFQEKNENVLDGIKFLQNQQVLQTVNQIFIMGSTPMQSALKNVFEELKTKAEITTNMNMPMQCMMQGICGQCMHVTENAVTFCCQSQESPLETVDFSLIQNRSKGNSLLEKTTRLYLEYLQKSYS